LPAHNEEKIIKKSLDNLSSLPSNDYEVLIGLDGCTDGTQQIVESFVKIKPNIFRYFLLNERKGKPAVIDKLIAQATGEIIIIHDADWVFKVNKKEYLVDMVSWFDDPKLGGVAESFPIEYGENLNHKSLAFNSIAWAHYFLFEFQKERFTKKLNGVLYI